MIALMVGSWAIVAALVLKMEVAAPAPHEGTEEGPQS